MGRHAGLIDFEILSLTQEKVMFAGGQPEASFQQGAPVHATGLPLVQTGALGRGLEWR